MKYVELKNQEVTELWVKELPSQNSRNPTADLDYHIKGRASSIFASIMLYSSKKNYYHLHLYEQNLLHKYVGFLDILKFIEFGDLDSVTLKKQGFAIDYCLVPQANQIVFTCLDSLYLLVEERVSKIWNVAKKIDNLSGLDIRLIKSTFLHITARSEILVVQNNRHLTNLNSSL